MKHLLSAADLSREDALAILDDADRFSQALLGREVKKLPTLRGRTIITMFYENSTRTRVSFEVAGKWMSADVINVSASGSSVSKGESLRDTALTLRAAGADALIIRHPASGAAQQLAEWTATEDGGPSVINAGDGTHEHPTQALLDALTIRQRLGGIEGKRVVIVGDVLHSRVARSNVLLLDTLGAEVVLVAPPTLVTLPLRLLLVALPLPLLLVVAATVGTCIVAVVVIGERDVSRSGPDRRCQDEGCGNPADRRPYRVDVNCRSFHSGHPFLEPWRIARLGFRICPVKRRRGQCFFPIVWSP